MRVRHTVPLLAAVALALAGCREVQAPTWPTPTPAPTSTTTAPAPTSTPTTTTAAPTTTVAPTSQTTIRPAPTSAQPTSIAPPLPAAVPVGAREIFRGDFNGGNLSQFVTVQTRDRNGNPGAYCTLSACVRDGGTGHPTAARFDVGPGDVPNFGGGERSEVTAPDAADVRAGDVRFYQFSLMFPADFRGPTGRNSGYHSIVMQWHAGSGSPPLHLSLDADGRLGLGHRWDDDRRVIGPAPDGRWHDYVMKVRFGNPSGQVTVWRDGQLVVPEHTRRTMSSSSNYLKLGLYRGEESFRQVVWHDGLRITAP